MARKPRKYVQSEIYHIIIRGNNKQNIFCDNQDYNFILNRIKKYSKQLEIKVFAYCLMSNHVHILIGNANKNMSKFMLKLNTSYSRYFNLKYERSGHLFQGRYLSQPIENEASFKNVIRYILQNPQKIGLSSFCDYPWNSFKETIESQSTYNIIDSNTVLSFFEKKSLFIKFTKQNNDDTYMEYEGKTIHNDNYYIKKMQEILKLHNLFELQKLDISYIKTKIRILKNNNIPENRIARLIGISRKFIHSC